MKQVASRTNHLESLGQILEAALYRASREPVSSIGNGTLKPGGNFRDARIFSEVVNFDYAWHAGAGKKLETIETLVQGTAKTFVCFYRVKPPPQLHRNLWPN